MHQGGLLTALTKKLMLRLGKGYSRPNLNNMRKFYLRYPNCQTVSDNLSWSHICELIKIDDDLERSFYTFAIRSLSDGNFHLSIQNKQTDH